jgi:hypothetical protein
MQVAKKGLATATLVALVGLAVASAVPQPVRAKDDKPDLVTVVNGPSQPVPVTGQVTVNLPPVQNVSGTVNVGNFPPVQNVAGTVSVAGTVNVGNLPAVQTVTGTVTAPLAPFGVFNNQTVFPAGTEFQFLTTPNHDMQLWANVAVTAPPGEAIIAELDNFSTNMFFYVPLTFVRHDVASGLDVLVGNSAVPLYAPANSSFTLALVHDATMSSAQVQGSISLSGIILN